MSQPEIPQRCYVVSEEESWTIHWATREGPELRGVDCQTPLRRYQLLEAEPDPELLRFLVGRGARPCRHCFPPSAPLTRSLA